MTLAGVTVQNDRFRGRIELGATAKHPSGIAFSASLSHDGIGNCAFHANRAHVWIVVPID